VTEFFISGLMTTLLFLLPLGLLPAAAGLFWLRVRRRQAELPPEEARLRQLNFNIARYLVYLLITPAIMLITSLYINKAGGHAALLDSFIWLIVAIAIAFTWIIYRLVGFVSARTRATENAHGNP
jgi:uncharacterized Tic20 family protein